MEFQQHSKGQPESLYQSATGSLARGDFHSRTCQDKRWSLRKITKWMKCWTTPLNHISDFKYRQNIDLTWLGNLTFPYSGDSLGTRGEPQQFLSSLHITNLILAGQLVERVNNINIHEWKPQNRNLYSVQHTRQTTFCKRPVLPHDKSHHFNSQTPPHSLQVPRQPARLMPSRG